jgi:hypothetical protein
MVRRTLMPIGAMLLAVSACMPTGMPYPSPSPIPPGTSPREAILGRPVTDADCFTTAFDLVQVPDAPTLERHVSTAVRRPAWLPLRGFLGTPTELAHAVHGQLIEADPQTVWVLVPGDGAPQADRYFPLVTRSGARIWYRDGSVLTCL